MTLLGLTYGLQPVRCLRQSEVCLKYLPSYSLCEASDSSDNRAAKTPDRLLVIVVMPLLVLCFGSSSERGLRRPIFQSVSKCESLCWIHTTSWNCPCKTFVLASCSSRVGGAAVGWTPEKSPVAATKPHSVASLESPTGSSTSTTQSS